MTGKYDYFGNLSPGDKFIFNTYKYEKVSGNTAINLYYHNESVEIDSLTKVFVLYV